jgi:signal peptidase
MRPSLRTLSSLALAIAIALWLLFLRPTFLGGGQTYLIVSGHSMEPTLLTGDLTILERHAAYRKGDIVAYRADGGVIIHRIVGGSAARGYVVQGDNRDAPDHWRPRVGDVLGMVAVKVPKAGLLVAWLRKPLVLVLFVIAAAGLIAAGAPAARPREDDAVPYLGETP